MVAEKMVGLRVEIIEAWDAFVCATGVDADVLDEEATMARYVDAVKEAVEAALDEVQDVCVGFAFGGRSRVSVSGADGYYGEEHIIDWVNRLRGRIFVKGDFWVEK